MTSICFFAIKKSSVANAESTRIGMCGFMPTLIIKIMFCIACMLTGQRLWLGPPKFVDTIAEGIRTQQCGQLTFPILVDYIEKDVFTVVSSSQIRIHLK